MKERTHMQNDELFAIFVRAAKKLIKLKELHRTSRHGQPNETFPFGSAYSVCVDDDQITVVMIIPKKLPIIPKVFINWDATQKCFMRHINKQKDSNHDG